MKSILKLSASVTFMFFSLIGMANDNENEDPRSEDKKEAAAAPVYNMNSDKVYLKLPSNGNRKVSLSIYNEAGDLVHEERFANPTVSMKVLNFSGSQKGEYTIRVWNSNGKYLETFEVK